MPLNHFIFAFVCIIWAWSEACVGQLETGCVSTTFFVGIVSKRDERPTLFTLFFLVFDGGG